MLNYQILKNKNIATKYVDGKAVNFIDLLCKDMTEAVNITDYEFVVVTKNYVGRPDLISLAVYKTDEYADIICKINGISNPFELNEDMLIVCPTVMQISKILQQGTLSDVIKTNNNLQTIGTTTIQKSNLDKSNESISKVADNQLQKKKSDRRSPAEQTVTDSNFIIDKSLGIVIY